MSYRGVKSYLLACTSAAVLLAAAADANAGGFALREQSASGQGASFAGVAAGGALSSMYWNPSVMTQFSGKTIEGDASMIFPNASHSYTGSSLGTAIPALYATTPGNSGLPATVPATYSSLQINDSLWVGMSVNAPFGLGVGFPTTWAGAGYGQDASLQSYNFAPSVAYKINDWISVSVGAQVQYMTVNYKTLTTAFPTGFGLIGGSGFSYGYTAGVTLTPTPTTTLGIGYRSALNQKINGTLQLSSAVPGSTPGSVSTTLNLPDMLTVGLRQRIGDRFTALAGFEWTNWSRIGTSTIQTPTGATATIGGTGILLPFQYSDGYMYSLGGEYMIDPVWTVRAGIAYEKSPITDAVRTPRLPDDDRMWYSVGASYKPEMFRGVTFDIGYSYIDVKNAPINIGPGSGNPWTNSTGTYIGSVDSHIHILSFGLRYQWDAEPAPTKVGYFKAK